MEDYGTERVASSFARWWHEHGSWVRHAVALLCWAFLAGWEILRDGGVKNAHARAHLLKSALVGIGSFVVYGVCFSALLSPLWGMIVGLTVYLSIGVVANHAYRALRGGRTPGFL